eukprot:scaffold21268_cov60-Phaeocystis_antarctica.AAC.1
MAILTISALTLTLTPTLLYSNPNPNPNPNQVLAGLPTSLAEDEAALLQLQGNTGRGAQALHSRLSRKRCLAASRDACDAMWKTRRLRPRPAGSPEAPSSARSCLRLPRASASLGQSAAWAALAGHIGLVFHIGATIGPRGPRPRPRSAGRGRSSSARAARHSMTPRDSRFCSSLRPATREMGCRIKAFSWPRGHKQTARMPPSAT